MISREESLMPSQSCIADARGVLTERRVFFLIVPNELGFLGY